MTTPSAEVFEKLASFYLGRHYNLAGGELTDDWKKKYDIESIELEATEIRPSAELWN